MSHIWECERDRARMHAESGQARAARTTASRDVPGHVPARGQVLDKAKFA
jgi:hypothetical protein